MGEAEKLLRDWRQSRPRDGVACEDALKVAAFLGMTLKRNSQGHYQAFHEDLKGSAWFPYGSFTINCHAGGIQGRTHPSAISDILKAAKTIEAAQQKEQGDEDDTE